MGKKILQALAMVLAACPVVALAQAPKDGVYISDEDVKAVLKYAVDTKRTIVDNTIRVIDMNKYQLGVAVIHRGAMTGGGGANTAAAAANPAPACGEHVVNGRRSAPDNEVTTILNGPSCSGTMVGYTSREIKTGDIIVIPEGVPHGFSAIPDHVTYLSIRPDLKKVLQHGYVNPALKK